MKAVLDCWFITVVPVDSCERTIFSVFTELPQVISDDVMS